MSFGPIYSAERAAANKANGVTAPLAAQAFRAGDLIFVSGQTPSKLDGTPVEGTFEDKVHQCCQNIRDLLKQAGSDISRTVKVTVLVDDISNMQIFNPIYQTYFPHGPARMAYAAKGMNRGVPVEIDAVAYAGNI